ncbi:MAG: hypothetical protein LBR92_04630 [Puniceicoccales bacterium]|jgi:hypothetical protein|nr:hypothetical protein [Puniceicoccales bacterium]
METLHEKLVRMQTEEFMKKMGCPLLPLDEQEEEKEAVTTAVVAPIAPEELERRVKKTIEEVEQFFAHFGLTSEGQENLFKMPIIQQVLDEIVAGVVQERMELELEFGAPRNGWDSLPFEKFAETEKILEKLFQQKKAEKVEEIHVDEIFDQSAQEQIAAIQERLSAALEEVKIATAKERKVMSMPLLPFTLKREPEVIPTAALSNFQEKRTIDADFKRHYSEQLKVIMPHKEPQVIAETHLLPQNAAQAVNREIDMDVKMENVPEWPSEKLQVREVEAIAKDIETMCSKNGIGRPSADHNIATEETFSPDVVSDEEMPKIIRKVPVTPANGVVILALKSKIQNEKGKHMMEENKASEEQLAVNLFNGVTLPGLPFSGKVLSKADDPQSGENQSKTLAACRRQIGPHRFQL